MLHLLVSLKVKPKFWFIYYKIPYDIIAYKFSPVNLLIVKFGILEGWSSSTNILHTSDETPLPTREITTEEASWVTSLMPLGALISYIFFGYITDNFG